MITDHNSLQSLVFRDFFRNHGIDVIIGEEILTTEGEIIGMFLKEEIPAKMSPEMTVREIKKQGGMVYIPHPCDSKRKKTVLAQAAAKRIEDSIDFIEFSNARSSQEDRRGQKARMEEIKKSNREIVGIVGSDAHIWWELGRNYCIVDRQLTKENIKQCIRNGSFQMQDGSAVSHKWTKLVKGMKLIRNLETMQYLTMPMQEVRQRCTVFAETIAQDFRPELVIFIAKGGFLIGRALAEYFGVPMADIATERSGGRMKKFIAPFFKALPGRVRFWMIELEMHLGIHKVVQERKVCMSPELRYMAEKGKYRNILIADDSIDTGNTLCSVRAAVEELFPGAVIKTAGISVIRYSEDRMKTDYYLFKDTIINTGTSKDSKEHGIFLKEYGQWIKGFYLQTR